MTICLAKQDRVQLTNDQWGNFSGDIYTEFRVSYPVGILTTNTDRQAAAPILVFQVTQPTRWHYVLTGRSTAGEITCSLKSRSKSLLGFPALTGSATCGTSIATLTLASPADSQVLSRFTPEHQSWEISLRRAAPVGNESNLVLTHATAGDLIQIIRRDNSWNEQRESRLGFGRLKRGAFLREIDTLSESDFVKFGVVVSLATYFQIGELPLNTDLPSG
jgi:hypothetical protein